MTRFHGADTEALRDLSALVARRTEVLHEIDARLRSRVEGATWTGPDADAFRTEWSFRVRPLLADAAHLLRRRSHALAVQADAQDAASAPDGPGLRIPLLRAPALPPAPGEARPQLLRAPLGLPELFSCTALPTGEGIGCGGDLLPPGPPGAQVSALLGHE